MDLDNIQRKYGLPAPLPVVQNGKFAPRFPLNLEHRGDDVFQFGGKYIGEIENIYDLLYKILTNQEIDASLALPYAIKITEDKLYIRDKTNSEWILIFDITKPNFPKEIELYELIYKAITHQVIGEDNSYPGQFKIEENILYMRDKDNLTWTQIGDVTKEFLGATEATQAILEQINEILIEVQELKTELNRQIATTNETLTTALQAANEAMISAQSINIRTFNSVEEMKASNTLKAGALAKTLGFYTAGDGGGADYVINDDISEDEVDEAIALQNGLYAKLLIKNSIVDIKIFGAIGDGVTDNTEAISKANSFANKNGYTLLISNGVFGITSVNIDCKNVIGAYNSNLSKLLCIKDTDIMVTRRNCDISNLENITIDCNNKANVGIDTSYTLQNGPSVNANHRNVRVVNPKVKGWVAQNANDVWWEGVQVVGSNNAVALEAIGAGGPITIKDCNFLTGEVILSGQYINLTNNVLKGIHLASEGWNVLSCIGNYIFPDSNNVNITLDGPCWGMSFIGTHIEGRNGGSIIGGTSKINTRRILFEGCHIFSTNGNANMIATNIGLPYFSPTIIDIQGGTLENTITLNQSSNFVYSLNSCKQNNDKLLSRLQNVALDDISYTADYFFVRRATNGITVTINKNTTTNIDIESAVGTSIPATGFIIVQTNQDAPRCILAYAKSGSTVIKVQEIVAVTGTGTYSNATLTVNANGTNNLSIISTANANITARIMFVGFAGGY